MDELEFKALVEQYLINNGKKISDLTQTQSTTGLYLQGYNSSGSVRIDATLLETQE